MRIALGAERSTASDERASTSSVVTGVGVAAAGPISSFTAISRLPAGGSATENSNNPLAIAAGYGAAPPASGSSLSTDFARVLTVAPAGASRLEFAKNHNSPSFRRRLWGRRTAPSHRRDFGVS